MIPPMMEHQATGSGNILVDLESPRWDQSTYLGRAKHFFMATNPLNLFVTPGHLDYAKEIVTKHRRGEDTGLSADNLWKLKYLYDSAFHPDTGEKMVLIGRMSAQVPMNMAITGCMMTFYKTTPQVVFWQWLNQSFNALVNYTNRSGDSPIPSSVLGTSYICATGGALTTALGLNAMVKSLPPVVGRIVPFCACAAANCINIPMMRRQELQEGAQLLNEMGEKVGENSQMAAQKGIGMVVASRIGMMAPGMILIPMLMDKLEKRGILHRYPKINAPIQIALCGLLLTMTTPLCCAIFPQKTSIRVDNLPDDLRERLRAKGYNNSYLYFNKGL